MTESDYKQLMRRRKVERFLYQHLPITRRSASRYARILFSVFGRSKTA